MPEETNVESADEVNQESTSVDSGTEPAGDTQTDSTEDNKSSESGKDHDSILMSRWQKEAHRSDQLEQELREREQRLAELESQINQQSDTQRQQYDQEALDFAEMIKNEAKEAALAEIKLQQESEKVSNSFNQALDNIKSNDPKFSQEDEISLYKYMDSKGIYDAEAAYNTLFQERIIKSKVDAQVAEALKKRSSAVETAGQSTGSAPIKSNAPSIKASLQDKIANYLGQ